MGRRSRYTIDSELDPINKWMSQLKLKDLKRACIMRGLSFRMVGEYDVHQLQSWLYRNHSTRQDPRLLEKFDIWRDKTLMEEGAIDEPIHIDLKLGFYKTDKDGGEKRERRNVNLLGVTKSLEEQAIFVPRKGSKKTLAYDLIREGKSTQEIIKIVMDTYPDVSEGSIKVWCSQARKIERIKEEIGD
jgi:hypothetical protein